jgi:hypothetical protein
MTAGMADSCQRSPDLGEPALMRRAIAEIRRDYLGDPSRIFINRLFELGEVRAPRFQRGRSVAKKRLAWRARIAPSSPAPFDCAKCCTAVAVMVVIIDLSRFASETQTLRDCDDCTYPEKSSLGSGGERRKSNLIAEGLELSEAAARASRLGKHFGGMRAMAEKSIAIEKLSHRLAAQDASFILLDPTVAFGRESPTAAGQPA